MALAWLTDSNLGIFATTHPFDESPVLIQYQANSYAKIYFIQGNLPTGLSYQTYPGYIRIIGNLNPAALSQVYSFTFRIDNLDGNVLDQQFTMELLSSPVPVWESPGQLGSYAENYSFNVNPLNIRYSSDSAAKVKLLNGALPSGLSWTTSTGNVVITGESVNISQDTQGQWTFRITNPNGTVADKTFYMLINSISSLPDWSDQNPNLGYVGSGKKGKFTVKASTVGNVPLVYSIVDDPFYPIPVGMGIDGVHGDIIYQSPGVQVDTITNFIVRANSAVSSSELLCYVTVLTIPHDPVWITPSDLIRVPQQSYLEYPLEAYDPLGGTITYSFSQTPAADFPFTLDDNGLLYGDAPSVISNTVWTIFVNANVVNGLFIGNTEKTFRIEVTKVNAAGVLTWNSDTTEILNISDGNRAVFDIGASTTRKLPVRHGIIGGQCPPGLILDKIQGKLVGFVEYHPVDKDYWFNITATDGVDTVTRTIHMQVLAQYGYQFSEIVVPLQGDIKQRWLETNQYIITNPDMNVNVSVVGNQLYYPKMSVVKGLDTTILDPNIIINEVLPYLQRMKLSVGTGGNAVVDSQQNVLVYRNVVDYQLGAGYVADHPNGNPPTIKPPSLLNLRDSFIAACGYANGGIGSGSSAIAKVNPEDGSIVSVAVINSGSGYIINPSVTISGQGSGAQLKANMIIQQLVINDPGSGWELGEHLILKFGKYTTPAEIVVTAIDGAGGLKQLLIIDNGLYQQVPIGKIYIQNANGGLAGVNPNLGIGSLDVISAGSGYDQDSTFVSFVGKEILENWQKEWEPIIPVALTTSGFANTVINNSQLSIKQALDGVLWQVSDIEWNVQGLYWQGTTLFDSEFTTWDGGTTGFQETLEPIQTIFDNNQETYELYNTTFDVGPMVAGSAKDNWGRTFFDEQTTAFEFYATIFDSVTPPTESSTLVRRSLNLSLPQISGFNITDSKP